MSKIIMLKLGLPKYPNHRKFDFTFKVKVIMLQGKVFGNLLIFQNLMSNLLITEI